jgi:hypothetical protein
MIASVGLNACKCAEIIEKTFKYQYELWDEAFPCKFRMFHDYPSLVVTKMPVCVNRTSNIQGFVKIENCAFCTWRVEP